MVVKSCLLQSVRGFFDMLAIILYDRIVVLRLDGGSSYLAIKAVWVLLLENKV